MKKITLTIATALLIMFGFGSVAQAYPPSGGGGASASPPSGAPGYRFVAEAQCPTGQLVTFTFQGESFDTPCDGNQNPDPDIGRAFANFDAPQAPGVYSGAATAASFGALGAFTITVVAPGQPSVPITPPGGLPATGSEATGVMTGLAVSLLIVGAGMTTVAGIRRRQTA